MWLAPSTVRRGSKCEGARMPVRMVQQGSSPNPFKRWHRRSLSSIHFLQSTFFQTNFLHMPLFIKLRMSVLCALLFSVEALTAPVPNANLAKPEDDPTQLDLPGSTASGPIHFDSGPFGDGSEHGAAPWRAPRCLRRRRANGARSGRVEAGRNPGHRETHHSHPPPKNVGEGDEARPRAILSSGPTVTNLGKNNQEDVLVGGE
ncbi:hypothetical protein B0H16DRAFT_1579589 [Mycena metata]|uniref:Uncharacterized protein n=1 Tax=Mycena metata TaxID=1033252 RepID=A0AAD7MWC5_9AGAR|nr:hypothetical protein B0H16DRAFT_1579589 [Mycena metata]